MLNKNSLFSISSTFVVFSRAGFIFNVSRILVLECWYFIFKWSKLIHQMEFHYDNYKSCLGSSSSGSSTAFMTLVVLPHQLFNQALLWSFRSCFFSDQTTVMLLAEPCQGYLGCLLTELTLEYKHQLYRIILGRWWLSLQLQN